MTLIAVVKDVCSVVGVEQPSSVFSSISSNRTMQEMLSLANEMAQRLATDARNWTALKQIMTLVGDGVRSPDPPDGDGLMHGTTAFAFPSDYRRLLLTSDVWKSTSSVSPMRFIPDANEWARRRAANEVWSHGEWTIIGGKMHVFPVLAVGESAWFVYLSKNVVLLGSGGTGDSFVNDTDSILLDERLLRLGMIWQWKANKGSPYAEDMGTYQDALATASGFDSPSPIIVGRLPISANASIAYQGQIIPL